MGWVHLQRQQGASVETKLYGKEWSTNPHVQVPVHTLSICSDLSTYQHFIINIFKPDGDSSHL